jgi:hypothetical protein
VPSVSFDPCPQVGSALWARLARHFAPHNDRLFRLVGEQWDWGRRASIQEG